MATRRCFSAKVIESDSFFALHPHAQALYIHLNMAADEDGFLNNAAGVARRIYSGTTYLKKLVENRFLLKFGEIYVIKHWRISNTLKNDRVKPLNYAAIAAHIWVKENRAYTDHPVEGRPTLLELRGGMLEAEASGIQNGTAWIPNRTEPNRTEENRREENRTEVQRVWEEIVKCYPSEHLGSQEEACQAYRERVTSCEEARQMLQSLLKWKQSEQWRKEDGQYIPNLVNWIQRGTWRRKPGKLALPMGASGVLGEAELDAIRRVLSENHKEESP